MQTWHTEEREREMCEKNCGEKRPFVSHIRFFFCSATIHRDFMIGKRKKQFINPFRFRLNVFSLLFAFHEREPNRLVYLPYYVGFTDWKRIHFYARERSNRGGFTSIFQNIIARDFVRELFFISLNKNKPKPVCLRRIWGVRFRNGCMALIFQKKSFRTSTPLLKKKYNCYRYWHFIRNNSNILLRISWNSAL